MRGSFSLIAMLPHSQTTVVIVLFFFFFLFLSFVFMNEIFLLVKKKRQFKKEKKEKRQGLNVDVSGHITRPDKPNWREKMKRLRVECTVYLIIYISSRIRTHATMPAHFYIILTCLVHYIQFSVCCVGYLFLWVVSVFSFLSFCCCCSGFFPHIYKIVFLSSSKRRRSGSLYESRRFLLSVTIV